MTLVPQSVAEIVRSRLGIKDGSADARIINQIPTSLKLFGKRVAADPFIRNWLITDKSTTTLPITTGGKVNLSTGYSTYFFLEKYIDKGQMYLLPGVTITAAVLTDTVTIADSTYWGDFTELTRVQFSVSGGSLPTGISAATNYYLINYEDGVGQLSSTSDGGTLVNITTTGSGTITMTKMDADSSPIQLLRNAQQANLPQYLDDVFTWAYIQGSNLFVLPTTVVGAVNFAVPYYPSTLALLPSTAEAEELFIQILTNEVAVPVQKDG